MLTIEDTNSQLIRNTAQCAMRNFATWWMDLAMTGWCDDQRLWDDMRRFEKIDDLSAAFTGPVHQFINLLFGQEL